jgi:hypothetical protein
MFIPDLFVLETVLNSIPLMQSRALHLPGARMLSTILFLA